MPDAVSIVSDTNAKLMGAFTGTNILTVVGWILFFVLLLGGGFFAYKIWKDKRVFNKRITVCDIVGSYYEPVMRDTAKIVKIGTGGFEILYLRKSKVYRIGYGGRVGKTDYYFFIQPDGYWYNGMMAAGVKLIDKEKGLIPVVTTNASMRTQYASLEKQIDNLHAEKKSFWDSNKTWMIPAVFLMIIIIGAWLISKEIAPVLNAATEATKKQAELTAAQTDLTNRFSEMLTNFKISSQSSGGSGLVPA